LASLFQHPTFPQSQLHDHSNNFAPGIPHRLAGMLVTWNTNQAMPPGIPQTKTRKRCQETDNAAGAKQVAKQHKDDFRNTNGRLRIFENLQDLKNLMQHVQHIMLNWICTVANIGDATSLSHIANIPPTKCTVYSILCHCQFGPCKWDHSNINNEQAAHLYSTIEPGIQSLLPPPGGPPEMDPDIDYHKESTAHYTLHQHPLPPITINWQQQNKNKKEVASANPSQITSKCSNRQWS
jgi:hypothetical protein